MKFSLPAALVCAISLFFTGALPLAAQLSPSSPAESEQVLVHSASLLEFSFSPSPSPAPQFLVPPPPPVDLVPEPSADEVLPSRGARPKLEIGPVPSPSPLRDDVLPAPPAPPVVPPANRVLFPVPPPNPAPEIAPPPREAPAAFLIGPPDLQRIARAKPRIEVWRSGSIKPQRLAPQEGPKHPAFVLGTEPVTIVLRFPPFLAGKSVTFMPGDGIALHPPHSFARIQSSGELVLTVELDSTQRGGGIVFVVEGVTTGLRLVRASLARVEAEEDASAEESP